MPKIGGCPLNKTQKRKFQRRVKSINLKYSSVQSILQKNSHENNSVHSFQTHLLTADDRPELNLTPLECQPPLLSFQFNQADDIILTQHANTPKDPNILHLLKEWAVTNNIRRTSVSKLLDILRHHKCFELFPKDARSLLQTPRRVQIRAISPGSYCHFPLKSTLLDLLAQHPDIKEVFLQLNVDGLPISRSSSQQFWPVLGHVTNLPNSSPFVIGLYYGQEKPTSSNDLLQQTVQDILSFQDLELKVKVHSVVCDAPARSFVLNVKGHTGYAGCHKCHAEGEYHSHRMTFPETTSHPRTDDEIRNQLDEEHHLTGASSELLKLPIDTVKQIPLDYQHLVCLGVVKKLLVLWTRGRVKSCKLDTKSIHLITQRLIKLKPSFSKDFARKPRCLSQLSNWKATEFRSFLLYSGPLVLKGILNEVYYNHFICLHASITILCSKRLHSELLDYANELLVYFVKTFSILYGKESVSYNIHNLIHLANDSRLFGTLDEFSTFKFESHLGSIKRQLRSGNRPLEQIYNRISESQALRLRNSALGPSHSFAKEFDLTEKKGDNCCLLTSGHVIIVENITSRSDCYQLHGKFLCKTEPLYVSPCSSNLLGISHYRYLEQNTASSFQVKCKVLVFQGDSSFTVFPLLHTTN